MANTTGILLVSGLLLLVLAGILTAIILIIRALRKKDGYACPGCGKKVRATYQRCPYCGVRLTKEKSS